MATLKKCTLFHARLIHAPSAELRALRMSRHHQIGWAQRLIVFVMFFLICAPVVARYVCGRGNSAAADGVCE